MDVTELTKIERGFAKLCRAQQSFVRLSKPWDDLDGFSKAYQCLPRLNTAYQGVGGFCITRQDEWFAKLSRSQQGVGS
eukprot:347312-Pyramimonas_sp.AAC.1